LLPCLAFNFKTTTSKPIQPPSTDLSFANLAGVQSSHPPPNKDQPDSKHHSSKHSHKQDSTTSQASDDKQHHHSGIRDDHFSKWADQAGRDDEEGGGGGHRDDHSTRDQDGEDSHSEMSESIASHHEALTTKKVRVEILGASNLENKDTFGKSDPYVRCEWGGKLVHKTRVVNNSCDPEWIGEDFVLPLSQADSKHVLQFECFDYDGGFKSKV
jgi:hypothetical protein